MRRQLFSIVAATVLLASTAAAQAPQPASAQPGPDAAGAPARRAPEVVPLEIQVVVSRWEGEKRLSSLPYSLAVNAGAGGSSLRMGANVPVPTIMAPTNTESGPSGPLPGPVDYREIGTNIDCSASIQEDGTFAVNLTVSDTSVYTDVQDGATPAAGNMPVFRTFRTHNNLVLRDGQSRQFTAAADRVSGEVIRIEVTLRVVK
jgi:hypothetical protein